MNSVQFLPWFIIQICVIFCIEYFYVIGVKRSKYNNHLILDLSTYTLTKAHFIFLYIAKGKYSTEDLKNAERVFFSPSIPTWK